MHEDLSRIPFGTVYVLLSFKFRLEALLILNYAKRLFAIYPKISKFSNFQSNYQVGASEIFWTWFLR